MPEPPGTKDIAPLRECLKAAGLPRMPQVMYEDNHLLVVNKPNGLLTHGDKTGDVALEDIVKSYIKEKYNKPGNVYSKSVHRLDRPVSGAIIFARTSKGHERMSELFKQRAVKKIYLALVTKPIKPLRGTVTQYLYKDFSRNVVMWYDAPGADRREAVTRYEVLCHVEPFYLVKLEPLTGRSHQLRAMLRSKRAPIAGDLKYHGCHISNPRAILLHAHSLEFVHPVRKVPMHIVAAPPGLNEWNVVKAGYAFDSI